MLDFWTWLLLGDKKLDVQKPGYRRVLNMWFFLHATIGVLLAGLNPDVPSEIARILMIPLSASLVGITFAWAGNVSSVINSDELASVLDESDGSFYDINYTFQLAALVILVTICVWGVAALKMFDYFNQLGTFLSMSVVYAITSCAIREGWHVILGVSALTVVRRNVRNSNREHGA